MTEPLLYLPAARVRLWDANWQLRREFEAAVSCETGEPRAFTLPMAHPAAEWLMSDDSAVMAYATVEDRERGTRWSGVLTMVTIHPTGPCPQCDHCKASAVTATFRPM